MATPPELSIQPSEHGPEGVRAHSPRFGWRVDGEEVFSAIAHAMLRAERSLIIVGWDFDTRTPLLPEFDSERHPVRFKSFARVLEEALERHPLLQVKILCWEAVLIYMKDRQLLPEWTLSRKHADRIRIYFDGVHSLLASHHQKMVVIDDALAIVGGMDLALGRWDTSAHAHEDARRRTPAGECYRPYHDSACIVDGEAARCVARIAKERWLRATGEVLPDHRLLRTGDDQAGDPWPPEVPVLLHDAQVTISCTRGAHLGTPAIREIEALLLRVIASARTSIYIESQYFTSMVIAEALAARLGDPRGPEILMVLPGRYNGRFERLTLGTAQAHALGFVKAHDRFGKFRAVVPVARAPSGKESLIHVHSKLFIADDAFALVGSANLTARSMGTDTEICLCLEARGQASTARVIASMRARMLGEHLGHDREARSTGLSFNPRESTLHPMAYQAPVSLLNSVDLTARAPRSFIDARMDVNAMTRFKLFWLKIVDFDRVFPHEELAFTCVNDGTRLRPAGPLWSAALGLFLASIFAFLWQVTPLQSWMDLRGFTSAGNKMWSQPWGPVLTLVLVFFARLCFVPGFLVALLLALLIPPAKAFAVCLAATLCAGLFGYVCGRALEALCERSSPPLATSGLDVASAHASDESRGRVLRRLGGIAPALAGHPLFKRGDVAVSLSMRLVPIAPFTVLNIIAGAVHMRLSAFLAGIFAVSGPATALLIFFIDWTRGFILEPTPSGAFPAGVLMVVLALVVLLLVRRARKRIPHINGAHSASPSAQKAAA